MNLSLPDDYLVNMRKQLGEGGFRSYMESMRESPRRSLRINTLKARNTVFAERVRSLTPNGVSPDGYFLPDPVIPSIDPFHLSGMYYVQEASAQYPVAQIDSIPGEEPIVLDLCAAPGGKTGQLAQLLHGKGLLIANEPNEGRCSILCKNIERLGITNSIVTCMGHDTICSLLENICDLVLVDAPCSGEGMFRKEPSAVRDWSIRTVKACAARQTAIIEKAAKAVKPGGLLIYSTCTFSADEDERVVESLLSSRKDFSLLEQARLYPHTSCGEGQFFSLMKRDTSSALTSSLPFIRPVHMKNPVTDRFLAENCPETSHCPASLLPDGRVILFPPLYPADPVKWRMRCAGTIIGEIRKTLFIPSHGLYMRSDFAHCGHAVEPEDDDLFRFLEGETIRISERMKGWCAVTGKGIIMGFGKADHGILKNHYPKGLRIRADSIQRSSMLY